MPSTWIVQQNAYKGTPPRAWAALRFIALDGSAHDRQLLVDTGCPCAVILGESDLSLLRCEEMASINSNFGPMTGAWLQIDIPDLGLSEDILGFASDNVMQAAQKSHSAFAGLLGLPLLRLLQYGGDAHDFWLKTKRR